MQRRGCPCYNDIVIEAPASPCVGAAIKRMKCPICGKQTLPGAKLCGPCRAALKRARDDSVWEIPGGPSAPLQADSPAPSRWVPGSTRLTGWRGVTLGAIAVALCVAGGTLIMRSGEAAKAPDERAVPAAAASDPPPAVQPPVAPASVATPAELPAHEEVTQPPRHQPPHPRPARVMPEPPPAPPPVVAPAPPAEPPRPPPAPPREAPRPVDPWQRMNEALAGCGSEDLFGRIRCEYRVRTTFCDGHWGEVPQCPGAMVNDHGQ